MRVHDRKVAFNDRCALVTGRYDRGTSGSAASPEKVGQATGAHLTASGHGACERGYARQSAIASMASSGMTLAGLGGTVQTAIMVGVDGGGSRCRVRAMRADGTIIGAAESGPANIYSDLALAVDNVLAAVRAALAAGGLADDALASCHVGLGLAGANVPAAVARWNAVNLPFASSALEPDSCIACRGAFADGDGAIAILGTGTAYVARVGGVFQRLGGWGFAVSDQGSGGWLGRAALGAALLASDRIGPGSALTDAVLDRFDNDPAQLAAFAGAATPAAFGAFAPLVMDGADAGDDVAMALVRQGAAFIERAMRRLLDLGAEAIVPLGGLGDRYTHFLAADLADRFARPAGDAVDGALALARSLAAPAVRQCSAGRVPRTRSAG